MDDKGLNITIAGPPGSGKTTAARLLKLLFTQFGMRCDVIDDRGSFVFPDVERLSFEERLSLLLEQTQKLHQRGNEGQSVTITVAQTQEGPDR